MLFHAKNGSVTLGDTRMDYAAFGNGERTLVMIPGLSDALTSVRGKALPLAMNYRSLLRDYRVYLFSRKRELPAGYTTRDMARDLAEAVDKLGIAQADVLGVSQGGMISQYLAIDRPELVHRLALAVTLSRQNDLVRSVIPRWMDFARRGNYRDLFIDTTERTYSEAYLKKYRSLYPVLTRVGKPKDFTRFLIQAEACLGHNAYPELGAIVCPTLVIGGQEDRIVGPVASREIAERIPDCRLVLYPGLGHGTYDEAEDFYSRVSEFFKE